MPEPVMHIPVSHSSGHIIIDVKVNGHGPFPFLLDTGASGDGRIDTSLVTLLSLKKVGERINDDGTGLNVQVHDVVEVDSVEFGGVAFRNLSFMAGDYSRRSYPTPRPIYGLLALELFSDLLLTIDYPEKSIRLEFGALQRDGGENVVNYLSGTDNRSCLIEVVLGPRRFLAGIDTGHQGSFIMPLADLDGLRIYGRPIRVGWAKTVNNEFDLYGAVLVDPLQFAGHSLPGVSATFAQGWGYPTVGYDVLKKFALTFDQKNRLIRFVRE